MALTNSHTHSPTQSWAKEYVQSSKLGCIIKNPRMNGGIFNKVLLVYLVSLTIIQGLQNIGSIR